MLKLYPNELKDQIGYTDLFSHLLSQCSFELGKTYLIEKGISDNFEEVKNRLQQLWEWQNVYEQNPFSFKYEIHIQSARLKTISIEGAVLSLGEAIQILKLGLQQEEIVSYFHNHKEFAPNLALLAGSYTSAKEVSKQIQKIIDIEHASIWDNATEKLFEIRSKIRNTQKALDRVFESALEDYEPYLGENRESVREGRRVLVVQSAYIKYVKGMSMGISGNGFLHYIIPASLLESYNLLSQLAAEEERELYLILKDLTAYLSDYYEPIMEWVDFIAFTDSLKARYAFSRDIQGTMPQLSQEKEIKFIETSNPSLMLMKKQGMVDRVVPFSASFTQEKRLMLISGPNAGGKSVTMKSLGLLQMLLQTGCFVPVKDHSVMTVFSQIMGDIGDRQSIDNSLSTYSAHLTALKYFLEYADGDTLIMIDEAGTGTDPDFGGVIAEVILEKLMDKGVWGCVTTHYNNLKVLGKRHPHIFNASMLFDVSTLQPLFELQVGHAGSSYAVETLQRIYPNSEIITEIQAKLDQSKKALSITLTEIQNEKHFIKGLRKSLQQNEKQVEELKAKYEQMKRDFSAQKQKLEKHYKEKTLEAYNEASREIEKMIREAKSAGNREEVRTKRKEIDAQRQVIVKELAELEMVQPRMVSDKIPETGNWVVWKSHDEPGKVVSIEKKTAVVQMGSIITKIPLDQLKVIEDVEEVSAEKYKKAYKGRSVHTNSDLLHEKSRFDNQLDIRGKYKDDAMAMVESFLDKALMLSMDRVRIVHGKGNGVLRQLVKNILKANSSVKEFYHEPQEAGGDGVTVVVFQ